MGVFGLLYFDNSEKRSLADKFIAVASDFQRRYKRPCEFGIVRPEMLDGMTTEELSEAVGFPVRLSVRSLPVQPAHIFVGAEDLPKTAEELDE